MALINCPECGNQISDKAITCPKCHKNLILTEEIKDVEAIRSVPVSDTHQEKNKVADPVSQSIEAPNKKNAAAQIQINKNLLIMIGAVLLLLIGWSFALVQISINSATNRITGLINENGQIQTDSAMTDNTNLNTTDMHANNDSILQTSDGTETTEKEQEIPIEDLTETNHVSSETQETGTSDFIQSGSVTDDGKVIGSNSGNASNVNNIQFSINKIEVSGTKSLYIYFEIKNNTGKDLDIGCRKGVYINDIQLPRYINNFDVVGDGKSIIAEIRIDKEYYEASGINQINTLEITFIDFVDSDKEEDINCVFTGLSFDLN